MDLRLTSVHRLLISLAILLGGLLLAYGVFEYVRARNGSALMTGILATLAAVGLGFYLRWFSRKTRNRSPNQP